MEMIAAIIIITFTILFINASEVNKQQIWLKFFIKLQKHSLFMKSTLFAFLILIATIQMAFAQTGSIYGKITDEKVLFTDLKPATTYLYRVTGKQYRSEWFQFTTAHENENPFRFIYLGDAQNKIFSHVSRVMRAACAKDPDAAFVLHTGNLINHADNDYEWEEWFRAGGFIHAQIPTITLAGNHEFNKNALGQRSSFSKF